MWGVAVTAQRLAAGSQLPRQGWEEPQQPLLFVLHHLVLKGSQGASSLSPSLP